MASTGMASTNTSIILVRRFVGIRSVVWTASFSVCRAPGASYANAFVSVVAAVALPKEAPEDAAEEKSDDTSALNEREHLLGVEEDSKEESTVDHDSKEESTVEHDSKEESTVEHDSKEESTVEHDSKEESTVGYESKEESTVEHESKEESTVEEEESTVYHESKEYASVAPPSHASSREDTMSVSQQSEEQPSMQTRRSPSDSIPSSLSAQGALPKRTLQHRSQPPLHRIEEWHVVLGDTHWSSDRTTLATELLRTVKSDYKKTCFRMKAAFWVPKAIENFRGRMQDTFRMETFSHLPKGDIGRVLIKCTDKAMESGRVEIPYLYGYHGDQQTWYGTANAPEALALFFESPDTLTLADEIERHRENLDELKQNSERPSPALTDFFESTLNFFQAQLEKAGREDDNAAKLLDSLSPVLKEQWKQLLMHSEHHVVPFGVVAGEMPSIEHSSVAPDEEKEIRPTFDHSNSVQERVGTDRAVVLPDNLERALEPPSDQTQGSQATDGSRTMPRDATIVDGSDRNDIGRGFSVAEHPTQVPEISPGHDSPTVGKIPNGRRPTIWYPIPGDDDLSLPEDFDPLRSNHDNPPKSPESPRPRERDMTKAEKWLHPRADQSPESVRRALAWLRSNSDKSVLSLEDIKDGIDSISKSPIAKDATNAVSAEITGNSSEGSSVSVGSGDAIADEKSVDERKQLTEVASRGRFSDIEVSRLTNDGEASFAPSKESIVLPLKVEVDRTHRSLHSVRSDTDKEDVARSPRDVVKGDNQGRALPPGPKDEDVGRTSQDEVDRRPMSLRRFPSVDFKNLGDSFRDVVEVDNVRDTAEAPIPPLERGPPSDLGYKELGRTISEVWRTRNGPAVRTPEAAMAQLRLAEAPALGAASAQLLLPEAPPSTEYDDFDYKDQGRDPEDLGMSTNTPRQHRVSVRRHTNNQPIPQAPGAPPVPAPSHLSPLFPIVQLPASEQSPPSPGASAAPLAREPEEPPIQDAMHFPAPFPGTPKRKPKKERAGLRQLRRMFKPRSPS
jgi:hypothetical protein